MSLAEQAFNLMSKLCPWADEDELMMIGQALVHGEIVVTVDGWDGLFFLEGDLTKWPKSQS